MNGVPQYPWLEGDHLFASALNAAIANGPNMPAGSTVNVLNFGAKGDGVADDTTAINAALNFVRAHYSSGSGHSTFRLLFPAGRYVVTAPLNFTGMSGPGGCVIDGSGSEIWAKHTGIVIDCLGSRWLKFRDLAVFGDPTTIPRIGIQTGRIDNTTSADYHSFYNVNVWGSFSFTAYYNHSSETCAHYSSSFRNDQTGANKFCMVLDGLNHWAVASTFVTVTAAVDTAESLNEAIYSSCAWQGSGNNGVVWIGNTVRHRFDRCYASCAHGWIFSIYGMAGGAAASVFLDIDCHCEQVGLQYAVAFTAPAGVTYTYVTGFSFEDHACYAAVSVLTTDPASSITTAELRGARLRIQRGGGVTPMLVDTPAKWTIQAEEAAFGDGMWAAPASWTGPVTDLSLPVGSFNVARKWGSTARPSALAGAYGYAANTNTFEWFDSTGWHSWLSTLGGSVTGMSTFSGGLAFSGGDNRPGSIYTDSGWGCLIKGLTAGAQADVALQAADGTVQVKVSSLGVGFHGNAALAKPTITGAKGGNAALASLLTALSNYGLLTDSTT